MRHRSVVWRPLGLSGLESGAGTYYYGHMVIFWAVMKSVSVVEAKAHFSALLAEVEAGGQVAVMRHGKVVARLVPEQA